MKPKVNLTTEGTLTDAIITYCVKKNIPYMSGVNGPRVKGWHHVPDVIIGTENDDLFTKCIIIEVKPTKEGAVNDLQSKVEYRDCKYLAAVWADSNGNPIGQTFSWRRPKDESVGFNSVGIELPLDRLIRNVYNTYKRTTNPVKIQIVDEVNRLLDAGQYPPRDIFGVLSNSFCDNPRPENLGYSLGELWDLCEQVSGNSSDEAEVMHNIVFREETRDNRYKLGQFVTEYPWTLRIAELVVEEFDKHQDMILYEPCVGTGAITAEVITLLFRKYGKRKTEKIIKEQLILGDIDPKMRAFAHVVLWNHTQYLFGTGIELKIKESDLTKNDFNLSNMICFGNYPFNAGTDYNYLAKIIRKQLDCGMKHMVLMGDTSTFDPNKIQSKKILGEKFYTHIEEKYNTSDFQNVAVKISVIVYDKDKVVEKDLPKFDPEKFTTIEGSGVKVSMIPGFNKKYSLKNGTKIYSDKYDIQYSVPFVRTSDITKTKTIIMRIPHPNAPIGSKEREIYDRWMDEVKEYPKLKMYKSALLVPKLFNIASVILYEADKILTGIHATILFEGDKKLLSIIGLFLKSPIFKAKYYPTFPKEYTGRGLRTRGLKSLPIPKQIPDRLYEIGQKLIIESIEDPILRREADEIIEGLYNI